MSSYIMYLYICLTIIYIAFIDEDLKDEMLSTRILFRQKKNEIKDTGHCAKTNISLRLVEKL